MEEVGVEPGAELTALEQRVLAHDAELDWVPSPRARRASGRRRPDLPGRAPPRATAPLDAQLDEIHHVLVVLETAPAGAGKTSALSVVLGARGGEGGWPSTRWPTIRRSTGRRSPRRWDWRAPSVSARTIGCRGVDASPSGEHTVVVIEDMITNPQIHEEMDTWLAAAAGVGVVIGHAMTRRSDWRRAARGELGEIRFDDLRFDETELDQVMTQVLGVPLAPEDRRRLVQRTEGWAVGVQLAALAPAPSASERVRRGVRRRRPPRRGLPARRGAVAVDPELGSSSSRQRSSAGSTHPVCGGDRRAAGRGSLIEELERRNLFVLPLDHRRWWYRYHPLFAEWLRLHRTDGSNPIGTARAAHWLGGTRRRRRGHPPRTSPPGR